MKTKKQGIFKEMKRTILMWLILRELQRQGNTTYTKEESKQIRQGMRQYMDRVEFAEVMAKAMADWSFYQKLIPKYHIVLERPPRPIKDRYFLLVDSLVDTAINHDPSFIEKMSAKTGKSEDEGHIRVSCYGDDFCSFSDLLVELLTKYKVLWAVPVIPSLAYVAGVIFG